MDHCSHVLRLEAKGNDGNESWVQWSSLFIVNTFSIVLFYVEMQKKCGNGRGGRTCQKTHAVRKSTRTISTLYQCSTPWFWRPSSACCCGVPLLHGQNCSSVGRSLTLKKNPSERVVAKQPTLWGCRLTRACTTWSLWRCMLLKLRDGREAIYNGMRMGPRSRATNGICISCRRHGTRNAKTSFESTRTRFAPWPNVQRTSPKVENAGILVWHACSGFHQLQSLGGHTAPTAPTTWAVPCLLPMKMMTEAVDEAGGQRMRKRESLEGVGLKCFELNHDHKNRARPHVTLIW